MCECQTLRHLLIVDKFLICEICLGVQWCIYDGKRLEIFISSYIASWKVILEMEWNKLSDKSLICEIFCVEMSNSQTFFDSFS